MDAISVPEPVADNAVMAGTDAATYTRERPGMSAFVLEDRSSSTTSIPPMRVGWTASGACYQWVDRAPKGANDTGLCGAATMSTTASDAGGRLRHRRPAGLARLPTQPQVIPW